MNGAIFKCPGCSKKFEYDLENKSETINCPKCHGTYFWNDFCMVIFCSECRSRLAIPLDLLDNTNEITCPRCDKEIIPSSAILDDLEFDMNTHTIGCEAPQHTNLLKEDMLFDKYKIIRLIGRGGMGEVYLANHLLLQRKCAIKVMKPDISKSNSTYAKRFIREAKLAHRIQHPNIIQVYDVGSDSKTGLLFIAMEYIDSEGLDVILKRRKLREDEVIHIAKEIAKVLVTIDKQNIVHRDIKPSNILFAKDGSIKLADLGIAKAESDHQLGDLTLTQEQSVIGTPYYASPEQCRSSHHVDARSDIYSLGATMYHLVSHHSPFQGNTAMEVVLNVIEKKPIPLEKHETGVSLALCKLIEKMMEKNPDSRPKNAEELQTLLEELEISPETLNIRLDPKKVKDEKVKRNLFSTLFGKNIKFRFIRNLFALVLLVIIISMVPFKEMKSQIKYLCTYKDTFSSENYDSQLAKSNSEMLQDNLNKRIKINEEKLSSDGKYILNKEEKQERIVLLKRVMQEQKKQQNYLTQEIEAKTKKYDLNLDNKIIEITNSAIPRQKFKILPQDQELLNKLSPYLAKGGFNPNLKVNSLNNKSIKITLMDFLIELNADEKIVSYALKQYPEISSFNVYGSQKYAQYYLQWLKYGYCLPNYDISNVINTTTITHQELEFLMIALDGTFNSTTQKLILDLAAKNNYFKIIKNALYLDYDFNYVTNNNTSYMIAIASGNFELADYMKAHGVMTNYVNSQGKTAQDYKTVGELYHDIRNNDINAFKQRLPIANNNKLLKIDDYYRMALVAINAENIEVISMIFESSKTFYWTPLYINNILQATATSGNIQLWEIVLRNIHSLSRGIYNIDPELNQMIINNFTNDKLYFEKALFALKGFSSKSKLIVQGSMLDKLFQSNLKTDDFKSLYEAVLKNGFINTNGIAMTEAIKRKDAHAIHALQKCEIPFSSLEQQNIGLDIVKKSSLLSTPQPSTKSVETPIPTASTKSVETPLKPIATQTPKKPVTAPKADFVDYFSELSIDSRYNHAKERITELKEQLKNDPEVRKNIKLRKFIEQKIAFRNIQLKKLTEQKQIRERVQQVKFKKYDLATQKAFQDKISKYTKEHRDYGYGSFDVEFANEIASILESGVIDPNIKVQDSTYSNHSGPLLKLALSGRISGDTSHKIVDILLKLGADVNIEGVKLSKNIQLILKGGVENLSGVLLNYLKNSRPNEEIVEELILLNCNCNQSDEYGLTPLHYAAKNGLHKNAQSLVLGDAQIDAIDNAGETPLFYSIKYGNAIVEKMLLNLGADANLKNLSGKSPKDFRSQGQFFYAIESNNLNLVNVAIKNGADPNISLKNSSTPLVTACEKGNYEMVKLLLDRGADVNQTGISLSPIRVAFNKRNEQNLKIFTLLLTHGANPNVPPVGYGGSITLLSYLCRDVRNIDTVTIKYLKALLNSPKTELIVYGKSALTYSILNKRPKEFINAIFAKTTEFEDTDYILAIAILNDYSENQIKSIIDKGANVNAVYCHTTYETINGKRTMKRETFTPIFLAVKNKKSVNLIKILLDKGADKYWKNSNGESIQDLKCEPNIKALIK